MIFSIWAVANKHSMTTALAKSAVWLYNSTDDILLVDNNTEHTPLPLSSITKILTVMVLLDSGIDLQQKLEVTKVGTLIPTGTYSNLELIHAMLIVSSNIASEALATNYKGGHNQLILDINAKAKTLGMKNSVFVDYYGSPANISTLHDIHLLLMASIKYDLIKTICKKTEELVGTDSFLLKNTNKKFLKKYKNSLDILVTKTGYVTSTCKTTVASIFTFNEKVYTLVLLGCNSDNSRFCASSWIVDNYVIV